MNTSSSSNLFDQDPQPRKDNRTRFALAGLAALGLAGALGLGFVVGGRGGDGHSDVAGARTAPTQQAPVSPTASAQPQTSQPRQPVVITRENHELIGNAGDTGGSDTGSGTSGSAPAPTDTPVPPAPAPTNTPVPPTATSTATSTATATATATPAGPVWTPPIEICIPCLTPIIDVTPPVFSAIDYVNCGFTTTVSFSVNEDSDLWVTYTVDGVPHESVHGHGAGIGYDLSAGFLHWVGDVQLHAKDDWGNEATFSPVPAFCF